MKGLPIYGLINVWLREWFRYKSGIPVLPCHVIPWYYDVTKKSSPDAGTMLLDFLASRNTVM